MRIVMTGANGQLAHDLGRALAHHKLMPFTHQQLDICDTARVQRVLAEARPDAVINTAAYVRVDDCEEEIAHSFAVNAAGAGHVARACARSGAILVHFSTDYVYGGQAKRQPLTETDPPAPLSVYGVSKLAGEWAIQAIWPRHYIIRTCGLYGVAGASGKGGNFVQTMLRLAREGRPIRVVNDQRCTPTSTADLAEAVRRLLEASAPFGLYHITNAGHCTWYEFAGAIFALAGLTPDLSPTTSEAFGARARRPPYSVLATDRYQHETSGSLPRWQAALSCYLRAKGELA